MARSGNGATTVYVQSCSQWRATMVGMMNTSIKPLLMVTTVRQTAGQTNKQTNKQTQNGLRKRRHVCYVRVKRSLGG